MKKTILFAALFTVVAFAVSGGEYSHSKVKASPQLRQNMTLMEGRYINLQILTNSNGVNYDRILKSLDQMQVYAGKIRLINTNKDLDRPLVDLDKQIGSLKKYAVQQNPIRLRKGIDNLYSTCFRCHEAHAPAQN
jgi:hypothetical protein